MHGTLAVSNVLPGYWQSHCAVQTPGTLIYKFAATFKVSADYTVTDHSGGLTWHTESSPLLCPTHPRSHSARRWWNFPVRQSSSH
jgi:hypothetical protein